MDDFPADSRSDIESELVDLGAISLTELRDLDAPAVNRAMRHVLRRTAHPRVSQGSSERID